MFVKICGITTEEDALLAVAMGADAVGFVFAPSSRQVTAQLVGDIVRRLPPEVLTVGVFRDEAPETVVKVVNHLGLHAAQLHGHESAEQTKWIRERVRSVIKAFAAGDPVMDRALDFGADIVLVDGRNPGSGRVFDWSLAEGAPDGVRLVLAGGLTPTNVSEAIITVHPWGVDVSSGVEVTPGRKDPRLVREFITRARVAGPSKYQGSDERPYDWMSDPTS